MNILENPIDTFHRYNTKIAYSIVTLNAEKQLLAKQLIEYIEWIDMLNNKQELKDYAKQEFEKYMIYIISRIEHEFIIYVTLYQYMESLEDKESFVASDEYLLIDGFIKILEQSYYHRTADYNIVLNKYNNFLCKNILFKPALEITLSYNAIEDDEYMLMLNSIPKK